MPPGRLVIALLEMFASANKPVILDGNFNTEGHSDPVRRFVQRHDIRAVEICLWGDPSVLRQRFIDRSDPPLTQDLVPYFEQVLHRKRDAVLPPSFPFHIDMTDFEQLETQYPSVLSSIRDRSDQEG
jgi:hypothetical protein